MTKGEKRDVTKALLIALAVQKQAEEGAPIDLKLLAEQVEILRTLDARTGRRDPSTRKAKP